MNSFQNFKHNNQVSNSPDHRAFYPQSFPIQTNIGYILPVYFIYEKNKVPELQTKVLPCPVMFTNSYTTYPQHTLINNNANYKMGPNNSKSNQSLICRSDQNISNKTRNINSMSNEFNNNNNLNQLKLNEKQNSVIKSIKIRQEMLAQNNPINFTRLRS